MRNVLIVCLATFFLSSTFGQKLNFESFDPEQLGTSFFYDAAQDQQGILYFATANGLLIYDGIEFNLISDENGLIDNFVHQLFIDSKNTIWISYYKGGLSKLSNGVLQTIDEQVYIEDFYEDDQQTLHLLTSDVAYKINNNQLQANSTFSQFIQLEEFGANGTLSLTQEGNLTFEASPGNTIQLSEETEKIEVDAMNNHFVAKKGDQLLVYSAFTDGLPKFEIAIPLDSILTDDHCTVFAVFGKNIQIGTQYSGLIEIDLNPGYQSYTVKKYGKEEGLNIEYVSCLFTDRERNLWIGSYGEYLQYIGQNRISIYNESNDELQHKINAIEYFEGELYVGTNFGLKPLKNDIYIDFDELNGLSITALKATHDSLWVGTNSGLFLYHRNSLKRFEFGSLRQQPQYINCIEFKNNVLHLGSNSGYYSYDFSQSHPEHLTMNEGLAHNVVESIWVSDHQGVWFDSPNSPMYRLYHEKIELFSDVEGYLDYNIIDFTERRNEVWIATAIDGIFVYSDGSFDHLTSEDGLFDTRVKFLERTKDDKIIVGHNFGVSIIKFEQDKRDFTDLGFIKNLEFVSENASYLSSSNYLWIGTNNGVIRIPHINEFKPKFIPQLEIGQLLIDQKEVDYQSDIELKYGNHYLEIKFGAIYISNAQSLSYKYILEGYDQDWNEANYNEAVARYQSLYDGEYNFKVKLFFNGVETNQIIEFPFSIQKPYWKEAWFYILLSVLLIILFIGSIYYTANRNKKIQLQLSNEVAERTKDLRIKNMELENLSEQYLSAKDLAEHKSKQIEESISYAKNIQKVLLRRKEYSNWTAAFKDFFLLFKPKDNVSGDFYWGFAEGDYSYVAVADCTGHGVPGAMISMLGSTFLQEIIVQTKEPAQILNELRRRVIEGLDQNENSELIDGMDISIIRLNRKTNLMTVAGAMNPVYIVRPNKGEETLDICKLYEEDEQLRIYGTKPNKQPIGFYFKMSDFTQDEIQLFEGDEIYLLSDGYVDQYGGPNDKKFMRRQLFRLFIELYGKEANVQKDILWNTMENWMGDQEQIDDISIIGIKI